MQRVVARVHALLLLRHNVFHHSCHQPRVSRASSAYLLSLITGSDRGVRAVPTNLRRCLPIAAYRRRRRSVEAKNDLGRCVLAGRTTARLSRRALAVAESPRIRRRRRRATPSVDTCQRRRRGSSLGSCDGVQNGRLRDLANISASCNAQ